MQENRIENMKKNCSHSTKNEAALIRMISGPTLVERQRCKCKYLRKTLEKFAIMKVERRRRRLQACGIQVRQTRGAAPREPETTASTQIDEEIETAGVGQNSRSLKP
jgi:hypothetical protein